MRLSCFKAYDIRGCLPDDLNEDIAYRIGRAYAASIRPDRVVVGRDVRLSSQSLCEALSNGLMDGGANVFDIGLCGTEEVYFATFNQQMAGGIMVTASHNPMDYNGMKLVREGARPISGDSGLGEISDLVESGRFDPVPSRGVKSVLDVKAEYIRHLLGYIDITQLKPLKVVVDSGNGCAGPVIDLLEEHLPFEFIRVHHEPDGTFPNGIPNPLLPENRSSTKQAVIANDADVGIAWDGDFDRCFLFDECGNFIEGYYIVGLLASTILKSNQGSRIIHDPRLTWNTIAMVLEAGGCPVMSKTGHAFIKERMRQEDAVYGGEMSAHHYFRDFAYCDSGMIPWLLVLELIGRSGKRLSRLVEERIAKFPASGEINRKLKNAAEVIQKIGEIYRPLAKSIDYCDGVGFEFDAWRFNLRSSNTEPVLRLNVEARGDKFLMQQKTEELLNRIDCLGVLASGRN